MRITFVKGELSRIVVVVATIRMAASLGCDQSLGQMSETMLTIFDLLGV